MPTQVHMMTELLCALIRKSPFKPFIIRTADGREVRVTHPEKIAYSGGRTVVVTLPDDSLEVLDLVHVSSLAEAPADGRGRRRRRRN
jgi:hypothetical protein